MNMKKVLAAILAVMMAVSAMAITAFAADTTIALHGNADSKTTKVSLTLTIPVYALYGYMTPDYALKVQLPAKISRYGAFKDGMNIDWSIVVNGVSYKLKGAVEGTNPGEQYIYFGFLTHDYVDDKVWTTIPQSTLVNDITSMQIVANIKIPADKYCSWCVNEGNFLVKEVGTASYIQVVNADDKTDVLGSVSYMKDWNPTVTELGTDVNVATYGWVSDLYNNSVNADPDAATYTFEWDHTLANKAAVLGAESAKVVVTLDKAVTGNITYTLWARNAEQYNGGSNLNDWLNYKDARTAVSTINVNGTTSELVFDVPLDVLYNSTYGTWNTAFAISEDITNIYNVLAVTDGKVQKYVNKDAVANITKDNEGALGELTWAINWSTNNLDASYKGEALRFGAEAKALSVSLVLSAADDVVIEEVEDPVEPSTEEEEDDTVVAPEEEPEVDENPKTGLALALVPMMVAAVAVVASKRR